METHSTLQVRHRGLPDSLQGVATVLLCYLCPPLFSVRIPTIWLSTPFKILWEKQAKPAPSQTCSEHLGFCPTPESGLSQHCLQGPGANMHPDFYRFSVLVGSVWFTSQWWILSLSNYPLGQYLENMSNFLKNAKMTKNSYVPYPSLKFTNY